MDLIYTDANRKDIGVLTGYDFDLAYGADENDFELRVAISSHCCQAGYYIYIDMTEYGGIIDAVEVDTENDEVIYTGRTWHGILNSRIIKPSAGDSHYIVNDDAQAALVSLISTLGLDDLFFVPHMYAGFTISGYKMDRYIGAYDGARKMLGKYGAKLYLYYSAAYSMVIAVVGLIRDDSKDGQETLCSDLMDFKVKEVACSGKVNHLVCLGSGELAERMVVHLYADAEGEISQTQTFTGLDEYEATFNYPNAESEEDLISYGTERFEELLQQNDLSVRFSDVADDVYDVGDIVSAVETVTGISIAVPINKKIVSIHDGIITVDYQADVENVSYSSGEASGGGSSSGGGSGGGSSSGGTTPNVATDGEVSEMLAEIFT